MRFAIFAIAATVFGQTILAIPLDPEISDGAIGFHEPRNDGAFFKGLDVDLDNAEANPNNARFQRGIIDDSQSDFVHPNITLFPGQNCAGTSRRIDLDQLGVGVCTSTDFDFVSVRLDVQGPGLFEPIFVGSDCDNLVQVTTFNACENISSEPLSFVQVG